MTPSLFEGFGLPLLEAMACSVPVCASKRSSLPEVGGDAAAYFDPEDIEDMTLTMRDVLRDEDRRADMRTRGIARAATFSWDKAARDTAALYERVIRAFPGG